MKKVLILLLCLSVVLALSGCSKIDETWEAISGESEEIPNGWITKVD